MQNADILYAVNILIMLVSVQMYKNACDRATLDILLSTISTVSSCTENNKSTLISSYNLLILRLICHLSELDHVLHDKQHQAFSL